MAGPSDVYLVTGGTGFLGVSIVRRLLQRGSRVRVLVRSEDAVMRGEEGVDLLLGCVTDRKCVERAAEGVKGIFHLVGIVEHSRASAAHVRRINVDGTVNVVQAAAKWGCKVVFASTSGTVAVSSSGDVRGDSHGYAEELVQGWPYYDSKILAEKQAKATAEQLGVALVILRPTSILGPGEESLPTSKSLEYYREKSVYKHVSRAVPYVPRGGLSIVDVRDVTTAFLSAMDLSEADGKAFCLAATDSNMTLEVFFQRLERLSGVPATTTRIPYAVAWGYISARNMAASLAGRKYHIDPVVVEMANNFWYVDSSLAQSVLGFNPRPCDQTLRDSLAYIAAKGHTMGLPRGVPKMDLGRARL